MIFNLFYSVLEIVVKCYTAFINYKANDHDNIDQIFEKSFVQDEYNESVYDTNEDQLLNRNINEFNCRFYFDEKQEYEFFKLCKLKENFLIRRQLFTKVCYIKISRNRLLTDSFKKIMSLNAKEYSLTQFKIEFMNELGEDCSGVTKEWLNLLFNEIFKKKYNLFVPKSENSSEFEIKFTESVNEALLAEYKFVGRLLNQAFVNKVSINFPCEWSIFNFIIGKDISLIDIKKYDPSYFKVLKNIYQYIKNNEDNESDINFTDIYFNGKKYFEAIFKKNGKNISVTKENVKEYIQTKYYYKYIGSIYKQLDALKEGFEYGVDKSLLEKYNWKQLKLDICGTRRIDIKDWIENSIYRLPPSSDKTFINFFWQTVNKYSEEQRSKLLYFVTAQYWPPYGGFRYLKGKSSNCICPFNILEYNNENCKFGYDCAIRARTCTNTLYLPNIPDEKILKQLLDCAIESVEGFNCP